MYGTLPSDMVRNFIVPTKNPNLHVSMAISILPNEVVLTGYEVEQKAIGIAQNLINNVMLKPKNKQQEILKNELLEIELEELRTISKELLSEITNKEFVITEREKINTEVLKRVKEITKHRDKLVEENDTLIKHVDQYTSQIASFEKLKQEERLRKEANKGVSYTNNKPVNIKKITKPGKAKRIPTSKANSKSRKKAEKKTSKKWN